MFKHLENQTLGHQYKLFKPRCRLQKRSVSFSYRTVDVWNSLPEEVASATSINSFKNMLDKHWMFAVFKYNYKEKFDPNACTHAHGTTSSVEDPAKSGQKA